MISRNVKVLSKGEVLCAGEELEYAPLKPGEALIRNEASLVSSGTELSRVFGIKKGLEYPVYPGYASVGRVEETGPDWAEGETGGLTGGPARERPRLKAGDRVLFSGAHREYQVFQSGRMSSLEMLIPLGPEYDPLSSVDAALLHLGLVAMNGILPAELKLGDKVCVFGLGVVGLITALLYEASGARVLGLDAVENRAAHARAAGLRNARGPGNAPLSSLAREFFGGDADIVVDATGNSAGIVAAVDCCGENGQVLLLGSPRADYKCNITPVFNRIHMKMISLIGAFNGRYPFYKKEGSRESIERNIASFSRLMTEGLVNPRAVISHVAKPEQAMEIYGGLFYHPETYFCAAFDWSR
ncbi:MAG: zinc-binding alcohol dehydrogenase [Treponema sp.]|jgi:threonine dehydrogenase-like Zn-dependent dehydrogenase|nr:zinc-binding alcohol dehydrogenase [Treponema sp.]